MSDPFSTLRALGPGRGQRHLTDIERDEIQDVLDAAAEWKADPDRMPIGVVANMGTIERNGHESPDYTRFCALLYSQRGDPRRLALIELTERLDTMQGAQHTPHGRFTNYELREAQRDTEDLLARGIVWRGAR